MHLVRQKSSAISAKGSFDPEYLISTIKKHVDQCTLFKLSVKIER